MRDSGRDKEKLGKSAFSQGGSSICLGLGQACRAIKGCPPDGATSPWLGLVETAVY